MQMTLPTPPAFDQTQWPSEFPPPAHYTGITFDFETFTQLVEIDEGRQVVAILGRETLAFDIRTSVPMTEPNYPLYFEVFGVKYLYVFSVWADRVSIEVRRLGDEDHDVISVIFPSTEDELKQALTTIMQDLS